MKSSCIIISDGRKGTENQSIALAKLLGISFKIVTMEPNVIIKNFPSISEYLSFYFRDKVKFLESFKYKIIITAGKKLSGYSILIKKLYGDKIVNIHIQNPKLKKNNIDILVLPLHDKKRGPNIFHTLGALSFFNNQDIKLNSKKIKEKFIKFKPPITLLLIGGDNKRYSLNYSDYCRLLNRIKFAVKNLSGSLIISTSRRTPKKVEDIISKYFASSELDFYLFNDKDRQLYPGILDITKFVVITSDSINMVSEVSTTDNFVYIYYFKEEKNKFLEFHRCFENKGFTMKFNDKLCSYKRNRLRNDRVLKDNILKRINLLLSKQ